MNDSSNGSLSENVSDVLTLTDLIRIRRAGLAVTRNVWPATRRTTAGTGGRATLPAMSILTLMLNKLISLVRNRRRKPIPYLARQIVWFTFAGDHQWNGSERW